LFTQSGLAELSNRRLRYLVDHLEAVREPPFGEARREKPPQILCRRSVPLAVVVFRDGQTASAQDLRAFLAPSSAKWWLPDRFEVVDEIPKTAVGKFRKSALREQYA